LEQLNEEAVLASSQADVTMKQMFGAELRWPLGLAVFMMVSQQLSGINAAMFYSSKIFERAQLPEFWSNIGLTISSLQF
jgi:MFS transporter, SP family, solute carrier family 2 (facilitated glucose transporter), member 1